MNKIIMKFDYLPSHSRKFVMLASIRLHNIDGTMHFLQWGFARINSIGA